MLHEHPWARAAACRVLRLPLKSGQKVFSNNDAMFQTVKNTCHQLKADLNTEAAEIVESVLTLLSEIMPVESFSWLFTRLSFLLRQSKFQNCQDTILRFYKNMAERKSALMEKSLNCVLESVYRVQSSRDSKAVSKETRLLAEELMDVLEDKIGGEMYMTTLESVRNAVFDARAKSKTRKAD